MRSLAGLALLAALSSCVWAQRSLAPPHGLPRTTFSRPHHHFGHSGTAYPVAFFDPFYADYPSTSAPAKAEPQVVLLQAPALASEAAPAPPAEPLLIELQDNRYVQVSGKNDSRTQMISAEERSSTREARSFRPSEAPVQIVVLLFRDGHSEEVSGYTIVDGFLYASADYYSSRTWVRKVDLTSLNLPETTKTNQSRGVSFRLPSASNEVIVGP